MSLLTYIGHIAEGWSTIFEGMSVTFSHMFRAPITIQYPDKTGRPVKDMLPERSRGFLKVDTSICTACLACQMACPIQCIKIMQGRDPETKERFMTGFDIDIAKCMFCGLCTEVCPTAAIHFTREFEKSSGDIKELVFRFVGDGEKLIPYKQQPAKKEG